MDAREFNRTSVSRLEESRGWLGSSSAHMVGEDDLDARAWGQERPYDDGGYDALTDALACGEPPFDPDEPVPVRGASRHVLKKLQDVTRATYPARLTARPSAGAEPSSAASVDGRATSSNASGARSGPDAA